MCSVRQFYITVFTCARAHQVRKYAYRKQNVFNRFHILIQDHCQGYVQWCVQGKASKALALDPLLSGAPLKVFRM